jgi:hypothetical protein
MGLPPEVAKAGSKDKGLISSFMQNEQIKLGQDRNEAYKAGIKAKTQADAMQNKMDKMEAEEQSAKRILYNEDQYGNTHAENKYGNLTGLIPEDHKNQPFGTFSSTLKNIQVLHGDKATRSIFENFTGNVKTLSDPSHPNYVEESAKLLRLAGDKGPGMLSSFASIGENNRRTQALAKEQEKVATPFQPGAPVPVDLDGSGTPNYFGLRTTENSMQYVDASGTDQRIPTSIVENKDIQKMIAKGDVEGLTIAFRNQIRTEEDAELRDVSKLPGILQALIDQAGKNKKKNQP